MRQSYRGACAICLVAGICARIDLDRKLFVLNYFVEYRAEINRSSTAAINRYVKRSFAHERVAVIDFYNYSVRRRLAAICYRKLHQQICSGHIRFLGVIHVRHFKAYIRLYCNDLYDTFAVSAFSAGCFVYRCAVYHYLKLAGFCHYRAERCYEVIAVGQSRCLTPFAAHLIVKHAIQSRSHSAADCEQYCLDALFVYDLITIGCKAVTGAYYLLGIGHQCAVFEPVQHSVSICNAYIRYIVCGQCIAV